MLYVETPSNPGLDIIDIESGFENYVKNIIFCLLLIIVLQHRLCNNRYKYGADLVLHSATKFIDGQGRVLGGVVVGKKDLIKTIYLFVRNTGPSISPFNAWVLSKSLETLFIRMDKHADNAFNLAKALQNHPKVEWVKYPFLEDHPQYAIAKKQMKNGGGIVTFEIKGGIDSGRNFLNALKMISMTNNLGDRRSIASHPASTTHSKLSEAERKEVGITPGLIRISVGLEHPDDILSDIEQALKG